LLRNQNIAKVNYNINIKPHKWLRDRSNI